MSTAEPAKPINGINAAAMIASVFPRMSRRSLVSRPGGEDDRDVCMAKTGSRLFYWTIPVNPPV
ncbi:hypothetical protein [Sphingomonas taxi]|uniref:hypothetical protein n=1 Tax=Sphingomonas taxi TaxID=1549858 RepID=UPI001FE0E4CE|nr:hypothetical protein [Sphingomonas taxi]